MPYTKVSVMAYIVAFTLAAVMPYFFGYANFFYFLVALSVGVFWFFKGLKQYRTKDDALWAKKLFLFSVLGITVLSFAMIF